jgi:hypothetical protein
MWDVGCGMCEKAIYLTSQISHLLIESCFGLGNADYGFIIHKL